MHRLCLLTFGGFEARVSRTATAVRLRTRKGAALIAFLALQRNGHAPRDAVAEMLWSGVSIEQARHSLRQTLVEVRRALNTSADGLGDRLVVATHDTVGLLTQQTVVDVHTFRRCLDRPAARALTVACSLYRGEFLDGLYTREPAFDLWVANQRNHLHMLGVEAHERCIERLMQEQQHGPALDRVLRLLGLDPYHERAHRRAMMLYAARGDVMAAKHHYEALVALLRDELGVGPAPETDQLMASILRDRGGRLTTQ